MTRKGFFLAALAAAAAISVAAVHAAPKPGAEEKPAANAKGKPSDTKATKAAGKKVEPKKADNKKAKASSKKPTAKAAAKTSEPKSAALPLPKSRPGYGAPETTSPAFPTPIGAPLASAPATAVPDAASPVPPAVLAPGTPPSSESLAGVKKAIELARRGKTSEAAAVGNSVTDPLAAKLIEWVVLRAENDDFDFQRYAGFATANPGWPNITQFRRKAEAALWQNGVNDAVIRRYFASNKPLTAKGKLAYARALLAQGDRAMAQQYVRDAWRNDALTADMERQVLDAFGPLLNSGDHKARLNQRLYSDDTDQALRAAQRLGASQVALVKARAAVIGKSSRAKALLDAVPADARSDAIYLFTRAQWLRRNDKTAEAAQAMMAAPANVEDPDEWWAERRLLARKLLDEGDAHTAFRIARNAAMPEKEGARVEHLFTAGWIAFRFLNDPATAKPLFARTVQVAEHPASQSRGYYWYARTAEALGQNAEAKAYYERAARFTTTYYGQIAHARLGGSELRIPGPPPSHPQASRLEIVRAMDMLYAIDERDLVASAVADLADRAPDAAALAAVAALVERREDARALALLGRTAVGRGLPFEYYAYPIAGLPRFKPIGPQIEPHVAYAIARQESGFNPRARSGANAQGLMQVLPGTAKLVAKKNGVAFDAARLLNDPVYNVQIGAAELGDVIETYRGSYILAFVAYNAGRGRVRDWIARFGDPRDPKVDPIDWVERIPFSETRNYVQRVMENMQVYRVRFGASRRLLIEADLRRGTVN
ncbi:lytic transglycosylase domain-containing protein [Pseudorhodoplanes sinuspersici]|uniref:Uncharacterized protein n=1 Tax=Pseudorhodoplanes sinuspersici TaxID=1235591 RepID=A0A1W6ZWS3_9HYPH|nr:lytic transglycosylase domain-containing protein [Pseudorhodoplanes sinuspersici]ARQ01766.1 hypothetical protein CAK95_23705 [Pseudorhodoplanes sinuspersici]RKE73513.1 soluble lytic murein transglycosylase [Pseudorhodoplanes sinuspersici]